MNGHNYHYYCASTYRCTFFLLYCIDIRSSLSGKGRKRKKEKMLRKRAFSSIFKSLNANFLPLTGHSKRHKVGKGAPLCLNGAFILSHLGPYGDGGTGKLSPWTFLIAPEGAQSRAVEALFFKEKGIFLNFKSLNANFCPWRGTVK